MEAITWELTRSSNHLWIHGCDDAKPPLTPGPAEKSEIFWNAGSGVFFILGKQLRRGQRALGNFLVSESKPDVERKVSRIKAHYETSQVINLLFGGFEPLELDQGNVLLSFLVAVSTYKEAF